MKQKRLFPGVILGLMALTLTNCNQETAQETPQRPNIIFIMSDDHAYQAVSAYGGPLAELAPTPNIDRLAEQGMRFNHCLVTNSICGPSKATILTGKYSYINGFIDNTIGSKFDFSQQTFTKVLQQAGYKTAVIGKLHLGDTPTGFDYYDILPGQGAYYNPTFINQSGEYDLEGYTTDIITDKTIAWLEGAKDAEQPFMVMMQHKAPHRAWDPGPNELGMYEDVEFPEPASLFDDYSGGRDAAKLNNMTISGTMYMDLEQDPGEIQNVYNDPAYANVQRELHDQLETLRAQYHDNDSLNQRFIVEYNEKVNKNPVIEYWKLSPEELQRLFTQPREEGKE